MEHTKIKPGLTTFIVKHDIPDNAPNQVQSDMSAGVPYTILSMIMSGEKMCVEWRDDVGDYRCLSVKELDQYVRWCNLVAPALVCGDRFRLNAKGIASGAAYIRLDMTPGKIYTIDEVHTSTVSWNDDKDVLHNVRIDTFHEHFEITSPALDLDKPLQTTSGVGFTLLSREGRGHFPLVGQLDGCEHYTTYTASGSFGSGDIGDDLMNVPEVLTVVKFAGAGYIDGEFTFMGFFDTPERASEFGASSVKEITVDIQSK